MFCCDLRLQRMPHWGPGAGVTVIAQSSVRRKKQILKSPWQASFSAKLALGGKTEEPKDEYRIFGYGRREIEAVGSHEFGCGHASCHGADSE